jgi:hypothetical protein
MMITILSNNVMEKYLSTKAQKASLFNTLTIRNFYICLGQMC